MYIKYKDIKIVCVPNFHEEFTLKAFITRVILFFPIHLVLHEDYMHTISHNATALYKIVTSLKRSAISVGNEKGKDNTILKFHAHDNINESLLKATHLLF